MFSPSNGKIEMPIEEVVMNSLPCDETQGDYFSRPLPVEEFAAKADQIE